MAHARGHIAAALAALAALLCAVACAWPAAALALGDAAPAGAVRVLGAQPGDHVYLYRIARVQLDEAQRVRVQVEPSVLQAGVSAGDLAGLDLLGARGGQAQGVSEADRTVIELAAGAVQAGQPAFRRVQESAGGAVVFEGVPAGYYLVSIAPAQLGAQGRLYQDLVAALVPARLDGAVQVPDVEVTAKAGALFAWKEIRDGEDADAVIFGKGQLVPFLIRTSVPRYPREDAAAILQAAREDAPRPEAAGPFSLLADAGDARFRVYDFMPAEFNSVGRGDAGGAQRARPVAERWDENITEPVVTTCGHVLSRDRGAGGDYRLSMHVLADGSVRYTYQFDYARVERFAGQTLQIAYRSELVGDWVPQVVRTRAQLAFLADSQDAASEAVTAPSETAERTYGIYVRKTGNRDEAPQEGAVFTVYRRIEATFDDIDEAQVQRVESQDSMGGEAVLWRDGRAIRVVRLASVTTDGQGIARLGGLGLGAVYYIEEAQAPQGFERIASIEEIMLDETRVAEDDGRELVAHEVPDDPESPVAGAYEFAGWFRDASLYDSSRGSIVLPDGTVVADEPTSAEEPRQPAEGGAVPAPDDVARQVAGSVQRAVSDPVRYVSTLGRTGDWPALAVFGAVAVAAAAVAVGARRALRRRP